MRRMKRSLGFALVGLRHAFEREKNLRMFLWVYIVVIGLGVYLHLLLWEWLAVVMAGGMFMATELLNTAIERFVDVIDHNRKIEGNEGYHHNLKAAKDVAAAASLIALLTNIIVIGIVFYPYVDMTIRAMIKQ
ncbi:diacylglycerol kinase [Candidatus Peribacteria bacterium]|nr:MAG: diacylglycerol kinase [Candidatus Peribacteria bacterium]